MGVGINLQLSQKIDFAKGILRKLRSFLSQISSSWQYQGYSIRNKGRVGLHTFNGLIEPFWYSKQENGIISRGLGLKAVLLANHLKYFTQYRVSLA